MTDDGKSIVLDATKALKAEKSHVVHLKLKAPKVAAPTIPLLDGWMALDGGNGHVVTRGVFVAPAAKKKDD